MTRVAALQRELAPFVGAAERSCIVGVHVELSGTYARAGECDDHPHGDDASSARVYTS